MSQQIHPDTSMPDVELARARAAAAAAGAVTSVTGTAPIVITGTAHAPNVTISAATDASPGSMSAADKTKVDSITAGANPSVLLASAFAFDSGPVSIPGTNTFTSVLTAPVTLDAPAGGAAFVLIGTAANGQSTGAAAAAVANFFVDGVESGSFSADFIFGAALTSAGSTTISFKTGTLAAGAHTFDLRVASATAGTAAGQLTVLMVTN